jgi:hypothetical protein
MTRSDTDDGEKSVCDLKVVELVRPFSLEVKKANLTLTCGW